MSGDGHAAPSSRSQKGRLHWRPVLIGVLAAELLVVLLLAVGWVVLKGHEASLTPPQPPSSTNTTASPDVPPVRTAAPNTLVSCGTLALNSLTSGEGSGPNTYELLSPTGVAVWRLGWDAGDASLGTYVCVRVIPGAPMVRFSSLLGPGDAGYVPPPTRVAIDSCGSVRAYAADGAQMLIALTAGGTAAQYSLEYQFKGGSWPTDIGDRLSRGTPQLLLITGVLVAPSTGSPGAFRLRQFNVARVSVCPSTTAEVRPQPIGFFLPPGCAYIDAPTVGGDQSTWSFDCGTTHDARGALAYSLTQQGWTNCATVTATATWAKGTLRLVVVEGAGGPGGYPRLAQQTRPASTSSCQ